MDVLTTPRTPRATAPGASARSARGRPSWPRRLDLSDAGGLSALSLRQVARQVGIVPTAFYRHFESIEDLGLVLVDESFVSLRAMLREVRRDAVVGAMIPRSVEVLERHVLQHPAHFRFIARERLAGPRAVRVAVRHELELCQRELATDIARVPGADGWPVEDIQVLSELLVTTMVATADQLLEASGPAARREIATTTRTQLRIIVIGALHWQPSAHEQGAGTDA